MSEAIRSICLRSDNNWKNRHNSSFQKILHHHLTQDLSTSIRWTSFFTIVSGTKQAYLFRILSSEGRESAYRSSLGKIRSLESAGVIIASLVGSLSTKFVPLWVLFAVSAVPATLAFIILCFLPEFKNVDLKANRVSSILVHSREALLYVIKTPYCLKLLLISVIIWLPLLTWLELSQLHYLAVGVPVVLFGVTDLFRFGSNMSGGLLGGKFGAGFTNFKGVILAFTIIFCSLVVLYLWRSPWSVLLLGVITFVGIFAEVNLDAELQKNLPDNLRATATSVLSFARNVFWCLLMLCLSFADSKDSTYSIILSLAVITLGGIVVGVLELRRVSSLSSR